MLFSKLKDARVSHYGFFYLYPNEQSHVRLDEHVVIGANYV